MKLYKRGLREICDKRLIILNAENYDFDIYYSLDSYE